MLGEHQGSQRTIITIIYPDSKCFASFLAWVWMCSMRPPLWLPALAILLAPPNVLAELPDLATVPEDIAVPAAVEGTPRAGRRVFQTTPGWDGTEVRHTLYLPEGWSPKSARLPVLVEYAGNGGYRNAHGDECTGRVEDCHLGYGITAGKGAIWVCMPFVEIAAGRKQNAVKWWGDVAETKRYCAATVRDVCARLGGDVGRVFLCGFSRGSIACNFIGLHDDEIAGLWRGFICHSHYDGVIERWPYAGADRASALTRLRRLGARPQWISHEGSVEATRAWLESTGQAGAWTLEPLPFRNHSDRWVLRDVPLRAKLRQWWARAVAGAAGGK